MWLGRHGSHVGIGTRQVTDAGVINVIVGAAMMHSPWDFRACLGFAMRKRVHKAAVSYLHGVAPTEGRKEARSERSLMKGDRNANRKLLFFITAILL